MKVSEHAVSMKQERNYNQYTHNRIDVATTRMESGSNSQDFAQADAAKMFISEESQALFDQLKEQKQTDMELYQEVVQEVEESGSKLNVEDEQIVQTVRNLYGMAEQVRGTDNVMSVSKVRQMKVQDILKEDKSFSASVVRSEQSFGLSQQLKVMDLRNDAAMEKVNTVFVKTGNVVTDYNAWIRHNLNTGDSDNVTFSTTGMARMANGKDVSFGIDLEIPKSMEETFMGEEGADVIITDALQIHLDNRRTKVSDMKLSFAFDWGQNDQERDTTKGLETGQDMNGKKDWVFKNLKVWTTDEEGKGKMVELKGADVGSICLRSANKQFRINNTDNMTSAVLQKREVFQKKRIAEGKAHMNLAV